MADFAPPFGLLESQQSAAAQIPYRNSQMALQGAEVAANQVVSAFQIAAATNEKRQQLENQLMKMQWDMSYKEKVHQDSMHEQAWMNQYRLSEEQRRTDAAVDVANYRERTADRLDDTFKRTWEKRDTEDEKLHKLSQALTGLGTDPELTVGTMKYNARKQRILDDNADALTVKGANQILQEVNRRETAAARDQHNRAVEAHQNFNDVVKVFGQSDSKPDDFRDPAMWKSVDGNKVLMLDKNKQRVKPSEVPKDWRTQGYRAVTLSPEQYQTAKTHADLVNKFGSGDPSQIPAIIRQPTETTRKVGDRQAIFDSNTKQFIRWADE